MGEVVQIGGKLPTTFDGLLRQYQPAKIDGVMECLSDLFGGFPASSRDQDDADLSLKAYAKAVEGLPLEPITWAVDRFIRGLVENHNPAFMPTSAEFAIEVRAQFFKMHHQNTKGGK